MSTKLSNRSVAEDTPQGASDSRQFDLSPDLVTLSESRPEEGETIRTMRTHIMARHLEDGRRGLSICAPNPNSGCTYSAVNLAVSLAQIGINVLLIDGDMRTPGVERMIRPKHPVKGLKDWLSGDALDIEAVVQADVLPDLSIIYAGGVAESAQELLGREAFKDLIDRCLRDFEFTIIDTPPANLCADALRISSLVGYSIVVARRNISFIGEVQALVRQIEDDGAHVIGTVLNEV